jgi:hypothetical protein
MWSVLKKSLVKYIVVLLWLYAVRGHRQHRWHDGSLLDITARDATSHYTRHKRHWNRSAPCGAW